MKFKNNDFYIVINNTNINGIPEEILILPRGTVKSRKGPFEVDKAGFDEMYKFFKERNLDIVVDYEHQTLEGVQAPAAGWIKDMSYTDEGIKAKVEWTSKAKEYLANKEYRYLSPVVLVRKSDNKAVRLHSVALTNTPAIDGMEPIINSLKFDEGGFKMEFLKQLAKLLGLTEDATEEQVIEAIKKMKEKTNDEGSEEEIVANKEVLELLDLKADAKLEDVKGKIIALKNPAGYVSVEEFNKLKTKIQKKECEELVELALSTGKITPAQKEWAETYALKDPSGFKNFIDNAPQVVPLGEISKGEGEKKVQTSSNEMLSINKMLGISDEDIEKYGKDDE